MAKKKYKTKKKKRIQVGEQFLAEIKNSEHSRTLAGEQRAGKMLGPFTASKVSKIAIEAEGDEWVFAYRYFKILPYPVPKMKAQLGGGVKSEPHRVIMEMVDPKESENANS